MATYRYNCVIVTLACMAAVIAANEKSEKEESSDLDYDDDTFDDEEFEYFYNMELLEKLEHLTNNTSEITEEVLMKLAEDDLEYEDTTELDLILDELLKEGDLIAEVLDEIEDYTSNGPPSTSIIYEDGSSKDLFDQIVFFFFLVGLVVMFIISSVLTGRHFYKKAESKADLASAEDQKEVEFVFIKGKGTLTRQPRGLNNNSGIV